MDRDEYEKMYRTERSYFWFVAKSRLIEKIIVWCISRGYLKTQQPAILDLGCGTGSNLELLDRFGEAMGLDHSDVALDFCGRRGLNRLVRGAASSLPFREAAFELVTALDLLEHLGDDRAAVREAYRVIEPQGLLLITAPAHPFLWGAHDKAMGHHRRYSYRQLHRMLTDAGFEIVRLTHYMALLFPAFLPVRIWQKRFGSHTETIPYVLPGPLNSLLLRISDLEARMLLKMDLPFGTTLLAVARKPEK